MNEQIKAGADIHAGDGGYEISTQEKYEAFVKVRNKSLAQARIKDLAERAFEPINAMAPEGIADRHTFDQAWFQEYNKSFAELVVNECIALLQPNNDRVADANVDMLKSKIKQHFGIEE